ncbi:hypothetical protein ASPTUDRAFT_829512 [Aspergillus tubingensis CBS 134.48]|uniref:Uncharacterized protein n=1 Tax=Aspergillus tubingensis (strain CBS 134.48) TaxID=767770 RepID=A0A1L9MWV2_ASPTC|nr:hypothetical protein ASPTUDRAFT_829512 [Aspergillus tubingensis CBS 134.48]
MLSCLSDGAFPSLCYCHCKLPVLCCMMSVAIAELMGGGGESDNHSLLFPYLSVSMVFYQSIYCVYYVVMITFIAIDREEYILLCSVCTTVIDDVDDVVVYIRIINPFFSCFAGNTMSEVKRVMKRKKRIMKCYTPFNKRNKRKK